MSSLSRKFAAYWQCLRVSDSLGYVVVVLIGAGSFFSTQGAQAAVLLLFTFLVGELLMGSIFVLNNRFDYSVDKGGGLGKASINPVSTGAVGQHGAEILSLLLMIGGLATVFFAFADAMSALLYLFAWILGLLYSAPPFRFKARAGLDIFSHGAVVVLLFLMGYSFSGAVSVQAFVFAAPFFMLSTIYELRNHIKDVETDSLVGLRTSVSTIGLGGARKLLNLSIVLFWASVFGVGALLGGGMMPLVVATILSYTAFLVFLSRRAELIFDLHLWIMGGIYSGFRLLVLAGFL